MAHDGYGGYDSYDDDTEETWQRADRRQRFGLIGLSVAVVLVVLVGAVGLTMAVRGHDTANAEPAALAGPSFDASSAAPQPPVQRPSVAPSTAPPAPSATTRSPTPKATRKSLAPPKQTNLPPPPPPPAPSSCQGHLVGTAAAKSEVRAALDKVANTKFWHENPDPAINSIAIPVKLMHAVAEQESGWQSNIVACDGGVGTMQVMPDTATWMNLRYATSYDINTLAGNTSLGGEYLSWLTRYFGEQLGTFDLTATDQTLLNAVISAYNYGYGAVDLSKGDAGIPNWSYVRKVKALMVSCKCDSY